MPNSSTLDQILDELEKEFQPSAPPHSPQKKVPQETAVGQVKKKVGAFLSVFVLTALAMGAISGMVLLSTSQDLRQRAAEQNPYCKELGNSCGNGESCCSGLKCNLVMNRCEPDQPVSCDNLPEPPESACAGQNVGDPCKFIAGGTCQYDHGCVCTMPKLTAPPLEIRGYNCNPITCDCQTTSVTNPDCVDDEATCEQKCRTARLSITPTPTPAFECNPSTCVCVSSNKPNCFRSKDVCEKMCREYKAKFTPTPTPRRTVPVPWWRRIPN